MKRNKWAKALDVDRNKAISMVPYTKTLYTGYEMGRKCYVSTGILEMGNGVAICMQRVDPKRYKGWKDLKKVEMTMDAPGKKNKRKSLPMYSGRVNGRLYKSA